jgi:hypothetical protein
MAIICQQIGTISGTNSLLCGKLIRIYDMRPMYGTIDVQIEGQISPQVNEVGNSFTIGVERFTIALISKNVTADTAVVQLTISDAIVPPPSIDYTDTLEVYVKPWPWYTVQSASTKIISGITDISGKIANYFSGITDYTYLRTDVTTDSEHVILNIRLKSTGLAAMAGPLVIGALIGILVATIVALAGIIVYLVFTKPTEDKGPAQTPAPKDVLPGVDKANTDAQTNCFTGLGSNPTCAQLSTYATCLDSVGMGINGTLEAVYPASTDISKLYDKYYGIYTKAVTDCNPSVPGKAPSDILAKMKAIQDEYKKDLKTTFDTLQKQYTVCNIPIGTYCADGLVTFGALLLGGYIIYKIAK